MFDDDLLIILIWRFFKINHLEDQWYFWVLRPLKSRSMILVQKNYKIISNQDHHKIKIKDQWSFPSPGENRPRLSSWVNWRYSERPPRRLDRLYGLLENILVRHAGQRFKGAPFTKMKKSRDWGNLPRSRFLVIFEITISRDRRILRTSRLRNQVLLTLSFQIWCFLWIFDSKISRYDPMDSVP